MTTKPFTLHLFDDRVALERTDSGAALVISRSVPEAPLEAYVDERGKVLKEVSGGQLIPVDALFGIYHLLSGPYMVLVTDSEVAVGLSGGMEFRKVTKAAIIPLIKSGVPLSDEKQADEDRYLELLHLAISSHHFYFSYTHDVTHTLQRVARMTAEDRAKKPLWQRADDRFFWNRDVVGELVTAKAHDWIVPMMNAYVDLRQNCGAGAHRFQMLFVSRRSRFRQGCRFTMRGADDEGHVANFVETEQALLHEDGRQTALVQIRGSIPLHWHSPVCLKYTPRVYFGDAAKGQAAAKKHVEELVEHYGPEGVVFVNLVNMKKDEQALGIRFKQAIDELADKALRYVWFDFHHECKKMKYGNLAKLLQEIEAEFGRHAFFARAADGTITQVQQGVVRTNCLDNLDRTNVVQSIIGRRSLLMQLGESKALALDGAHVLEAPFPSFEKVFKDVWGNNADAISVLYSGTGALKTDFTRTGKRTIRGALQDGVNSVMRFYKNNFVDATRQDALDLMLGRFRPDPANPSPFLHPPADQEAFSSFMTKVFVILVATFSLAMLLKPQEEALPQLFLLSLFVTFLILALMARHVLTKGGKIGKGLVAKPRLVPEPYVYAFYSASG